MIKSCLLSRNEIVSLALKAPKTKDGLIFFPRFKELVKAEGKVRDIGYAFDRSLFANKMVLDHEDLGLFTTKRRLKCDDMFKRLLDSKMEETLKGLEMMSLNAKVPGKDYTLEELIDTTYYMTKIKYCYEY